MAEATTDGGNTGDKGAGAGAGGAQVAAGGTGDAGADKKDAGAGGSTALTAPPKGTEGTGDTTKGNEPAKTGKDAAVEIALKLPEGFVAGPEVEKFKGWAKEAKLTAVQAQAAFDLHYSSQKAQLEAISEQQAQQRKAWTEALPKDKEFGGAQYEANRLIAQKAFQQFGSPELVKFLNETGLGDHPELVRAFWKAGKALGEDSPSETGKGASGPPNADKDAYLKNLYPNSPELFGGEKQPKPAAPTGAAR
jgi:hypothetical protein